jgi:vacuolar protein sorting-associated protein 35
MHKCATRAQALTIFEEDISDSRAQLQALTLIVASVQRMTSLSEDNHEPLRVQCGKAAQKLFKKPDKCRGICAVAHLVWSGQVAGSAQQVRALHPYRTL